MLPPKNSLELRPEVQGSFDFGLRGFPIAELCLSHGREAVSDPEFRQINNQETEPFYVSLRTENEKETYA
jgi:hypothetical protein